MEVFVTNSFSYSSYFTRIENVAQRHLDAYYVLKSGIQRKIKHGNSLKR